MNGWQPVEGYKFPVMRKTVQAKAGELAAALAELPPGTDIEVITGAEQFGEPTTVLYFPTGMKAMIS